MLVISMIFVSANVQACWRCWVSPRVWLNRYQGLAPMDKLLVMYAGMGVGYATFFYTLKKSADKGHQEFEDQALIEQAKEKLNDLQVHNDAIVRIEHVLNKHGALDNDNADLTEQTLKKIAEKIGPDLTSYKPKELKSLKEIHMDLLDRAGQLRKQWFGGRKKREHMMGLARMLDPFVQSGEQVTRFMNRYENYVMAYARMQKVQNTCANELKVLKDHKDKKNMIKDKIKRCVKVDYSEEVYPFVAYIQDLNENIQGLSDYLDERYSQLHKKVKALIAQLKKIKEVIIVDDAEYKQELLQASVYAVVKKKKKKKDEQEFVFDAGQERKQVQRVHS